jgi:hypothetical protein
LGELNNHKIGLSTVVRGQDRQIINSKNKNQILGKNIFSIFFKNGEKENFEEYSLYLEFSEFSFATLINYSTGKYQTYPQSTVLGGNIYFIKSRAIRCMSHLLYLNKN